MMTSSNGNMFRVTGSLCGEFTGEFPVQGPVTRNFELFFDLRLHKRLRKPSWGWWFETPSRSLRCHCNVNVTLLQSQLSHRPTVANSCTNQYEWHRLRMEAIFSLKNWGSYRVYLYAEPERFDTMIICESMRIRHEFTKHELIRCSEMQQDATRWRHDAIRSSAVTGLYSEWSVVRMVNSPKGHWSK